VVLPAILFVLVQNVYLALCGPVLWSSKEEEAVRSWSLMLPDSNPSVSLQEPSIGKKGYLNFSLEELYLKSLFKSAHLKTHFHQDIYYILQSKHLILITLGPCMNGVNNVKTSLFFNIKYL